MNKIKNFIEDQIGYKIPNSHFRLGSKIHIEDFYYAKRMFQNSFFSIRLAFIVAKEIIIKNKELFELNNQKITRNAQNDNNDPTEGLTLVGYGMYSALLISQIEYFINERYQNIKINHEIVLDYSELEFAMNTKFYKYAQIVVPIASTFSTSIKIIEKIIETKKITNYENLLIPDINILYVSQKNIGSIEKSDITELEKEFGFINKRKEKKEIDILAYFRVDESNRTQKYFIELPTNWYKNIECKKCGFEENRFYENIDKIEKPLYDTDETSVTPITVFDFPKVPSKNQNIEVKFLKEDIKYGHLVDGSKRVNIHIETNNVFKNNIESLNKWLIKIKETHFNEKLDSKVLLIAPGNATNTLFINLINEVVFENSAYVIHFNPENEHLQNFELIYSDLITTSEKIYFVDASFTSGTTFSRINYYIKTANKKENGTNNSIDDCFLFVNRASHYAIKNLERQLKYGALIHSFINLQLPVVKYFNEPSP